MQSHSSVTHIYCLTFNTHIYRLTNVSDSSLLNQHDFIRGLQVGFLLLSSPVIIREVNMFVSSSYSSFSDP